MAPAWERRKLATLVFCDVSGSTALGERVDPESVQELMALYFREMREALERHGGRGGEVHRRRGRWRCSGCRRRTRTTRCVPAGRRWRCRRGSTALNEELERRFGTRIAVRIGREHAARSCGDAAGDVRDRRRGQRRRAAGAGGRAGRGAARRDDLPARARRGHGSSRSSRSRRRASRSRCAPTGCSRSAALGPLPRRGGSAAGRARRRARAARARVRRRGRRAALPARHGRRRAGRGQVAAGGRARRAGRAARAGRARRAASPTARGSPTGRSARSCASWPGSATSTRSPRRARSSTACSSRVENGPVVAARIAQLLGLAEGAATADQTAQAIAPFLAAAGAERPLRRARRRHPLGRAGAARPARRAPGDDRGHAAAARLPGAAGAARDAVPSGR